VKQCVSLDVLPVGLISTPSVLLIPLVAGEKIQRGSLRPSARNFSRDRIFDRCLFNIEQPSEGADFVFCKLVVEAKARCRFRGTRVDVAGNNAARRLVDLIEQRFQLRVALAPATDVPQTPGDVNLVYDMQVAFLE